MNEGCGIRRIFASAVARFRTGRGRIADNRTVRCIHNGETLAPFLQFLKWIVAAGVQHNDAHAAGHGLKRCHQIDETDSGAIHTCKVGDTGIDRHKKIVACDLHAMSGVVDKRNGIRAALRYLACKILDNFDHLVMVEIETLQDFKPSGREELGDFRCIVEWICEGIYMLVCGVSDHEGEPSLRSTAGGISDIC